MTQLWCSLTRYQVDSVLFAPPIVLAYGSRDCLGLSLDDYEKNTCDCFIIMAIPKTLQIAVTVFSSDHACLSKNKAGARSTGR